MRRGRTFILVFLIIIIGLVVAYMVYNQTAAPQEPPQPLFVEITIAVQNIPQGAEVRPELLSTIKIAPENVVAVMYTLDEQSQLIGKKARFPLDQGVVITEAMVSDAAATIAIEGPQWASLIPPGMVAITTPIDRLGLVGYGVSNGAHVNINTCLMFVDIDPSFQSPLPNQTALITGTGVAAEGGLPILSLGITANGSSQGRLELESSLQQPYYVTPSQTQIPRLVCQTLLQDVIVMRTGNFPLDPTTDLAQAPLPADPAAAPAEPTTVAEAPDVVTFIVSPQDSVTLSYLIHTDADLSLVLRNPNDQLRQATEAATLQFLLSQYNFPVPAKLPYSLEPYTTGFGNLDELGVPNNAVPPTPEPQQ